MLEAVLIDLDNTMVLFDETGFYLRYMERVVPYFEDIVPAVQFRDRLLRGIRGLLRNNGQINNQGHFLDQFCDGCESLRQDVWERFLRFYQTEYDQIPVAVKKPDGLEALLDQLSAWGLRVVVATNPLFPEIAQHVRMSWVGLEPQRFCLLTHLENMSYVKPRPEYYQQICDIIGVAPQACLMVGNDAVNDMVAGTVGLKTFLTTEADRIDYGAITKGRNIRPGNSYPADFSGPLSDVAKVVSEYF